MCDHSGLIAGQKAFTYIGLLLLIVLMGTALASIGVVWQTAVVREKERELMFIGIQFKNALEAYNRRHGGSKKALPRELAELVDDPTQPSVTRYLRRIYPDPFTGEPDWILMRDGEGRIRGVQSAAQGEPVKRSRFPRVFSKFEHARSYADWQFVVEIVEQPKPGEVAGATGIAAAGQPGSQVSGEAGSTATGAIQAGNPASAGSPRKNKRRLYDCTQINQIDVQACEDTREPFGDVAANDCLASAVQRVRQCELEVPMRQLNIRRP